MRNSLFTRLAPVVAIAAFSANASAQDLGSAGISIAGEGRSAIGAAAAGSDRAGLFTKSAFVAPQGAFGFGVQAASSRASSDEGGVDASATASAFVVSGYYGLTSNISVGAYVPYARVSVDSPIIEGSESGMADLGVFGRMQMFRSASGMTKFALGAEATLPTGDDLFTSDDPTYAVSGAVSHRSGDWNLHVVPAVSIVKDLDPGINFNVAAVRAMSPRMSLSGEVLTQFGGAPSDIDGAEGDKDIDLAAGLRYRATGHSAVDFGLRYNVASQLEPRPTTIGAYLGFNWAF